LQATLERVAADYEQRYLSRPSTETREQGSSAASEVAARLRDLRASVAEQDETLRPDGSAPPPEFARFLRCFDTFLRELARAQAYPERPLLDGQQQLRTAVSAAPRRAGKVTPR
jgi:hypothetical protein